MQLLSLNVKAFETKQIQKSLKKIKRIEKKLRIKSAKTFYFPINIKKITVERSPHIDKKSREQFEMRNSKAFLFFKIHSRQKTKLFFSLIKHSLFPGVEINILFTYKTFI
jgi:small subunit ribosomal protein S10